MTDFLTRLAERAMGLGRVVRPVVPSRYAPDVNGLQPGAPVLEDDTMPEAVPPVATAASPEVVGRYSIDALGRSVAADSARPAVAPGEIGAALTARLPADSPSGPPPRSATGPAPRPSPLVGFEEGDDAPARSTPRPARPAAVTAERWEQRRVNQAPVVPAPPAPRDRPSDDVAPPTSSAPREAGSSAEMVAPLTGRSRFTTPPAGPFLVVPHPRVDASVGGPSRELGPPTEPAVARPHPTFEVSPAPAGPAPTVRVTIGRIEVRAVPPPAPPEPRPAPRSAEPALSLDDYLKLRRGAAG
jgi:hypothetical protein